MNKEDQTSETWIPLSAHVRDVAENLRPQKPKQDELVKDEPAHATVQKRHATRSARNRAAFRNRSEWLIAVFLRGNRDV